MVKPDSARRPPASRPVDCAHLAVRWSLLGLAWGVSGCLLELPPATCQSDQDCFNGERCLDRRCVPDTAEGEGEGKEGEGEGAEGEGTEGEGEGAEGEGEGAEGEGEGAEGEGEGAEGEGEGGCPGG